MCTTPVRQKLPLGRRSLRLSAGDLTLAIAEKVRDVCEISPRVVYLPHEEFADLEDAYKFKRFQDARHTK